MEICQILEYLSNCILKNVCSYVLLKHLCVELQLLWLFFRYSSFEQIYLWIYYTKFSVLYYVYAVARLIISIVLNRKYEFYVLFFSISKEITPISTLNAN